MQRVLEVPLEPTPATTFRAFLVDEAQRALLAGLAPLAFRSHAERRRAEATAALHNPDALLAELVAAPRPCLPAVGAALARLPDATVVPLAARGLADLARVHHSRRTQAAEVLCGALVGRGAGAGEVLTAALPTLPPPAAARAAVVLGLLAHRPAEAALLALVDRLGTTIHAVGALWGLVGVGSQAALEVARELYDAGGRWPAVFGVLWRQGDGADVARLTPLLAGLGGPEGPGDDWPAQALGFTALMTLYGLARRLGLQPFLLEVEAESHRQGLVAWFDEQVPEAAEVSFRATYHGVGLGRGEETWTWLRAPDPESAVAYVTAEVPFY
ncbi:MAG: hypothetical protein H6706_17945 [Myxococcales bacterium]|nr:hypothetical protein [Myxococcales bacterium]